MWSEPVSTLFANCELNWSNMFCWHLLLCIEKNEVFSDKKYVKLQAKRLQFMGPDSVKVQNRVQITDVEPKNPYRNTIVRYTETINAGNSSTSRVLDSSKFRLQWTFSLSWFLSQIPKFCPLSALQSFHLASEQNPSEMMSRAWKCIVHIAYFIWNLYPYFTLFWWIMFMWGLYVLVLMPSMQKSKQITHFIYHCDASVNGQETI